MDDFPERFNEAFERIGTFFGADRCFMFQYNRRAKKYINTFEWCAPGIESLKDKISSLSVSTDPWLHEKIKNREIIRINSLSELPPDAADILSLYKTRQFKSIIAVPIFVHASLYGFWGMETVNRETLWHEEINQFLISLGSSFGNLDEHKQIHETLHNAKENLELMVEDRTRELKAKQTQLVQTEKMASLGSLVAGVAHEINTPLGALKSNNDIFIRTAKKMKEALEALDIDMERLKETRIPKLFSSIEQLNEVNKDAAQRITKIVNSLRTFARLDQAEKDTVDLHDGLESTLTLVHHEIKRRIDVHKDYGEIPKCDCFPNKINQVFMNILVNASQAIEDKGDIYIKTYTDDGYIVIELSDTGKGIPKEILDKIFDPGFTTKGAGVGTGLGLSIVYQIIEEHKGRIEVESELGKGTTFRIKLPPK